jgi:hypothetical protein
MLIPQQVADETRGDLGPDHGHAVQRGHLPGNVTHAVIITAEPDPA